MTDKERSIEVFYSQIRQKYELPDDLVSLWFDMSLVDFELDVYKLGYDPVTEMFEKPNEAAINTIGLLMTMRYLKREQSRINKMNNIIGKDIQLNATGEAKRAVQEEYDNIRYEIEQKLHKLKRHCF